MFTFMMQGKTLYRMNLNTGEAWFVNETGHWVKVVEVAAVVE